MDFPLPPVGERLFEVELMRWLVRPGEAVTRGHGLMEVMSDKATMEVPAPFAGTIKSLAATPGTKVKVGQVVLSYEPVGELVAAAVPANGGHTSVRKSPVGGVEESRGLAPARQTPVIPATPNGHTSPAKLPP